MSHTINAQLAQITTVLDSTVSEAHATQALRARAAEINANLGARSRDLENSSTRIARALDRMAESGTQLRAAEARLAFQGARLKRSTKAIRSSLTRLQNAGTILDQRAREARAIAETADRTAVLISAIESAAARGESVDQFVRAAAEIAEASTYRRHAN